MNAQTLKIISQLKGRRQSDIARMAHVSRQAVSKWLKAAEDEDPNVEVRSSHLRSLAENLDVSADELLKPFPLLADPKKKREMETLFLWDRLYPSLIEFCLAILRHDDAALARLVETQGLFRAARIAGPMVWKRFENYKSRIRPARRRELEELWRLRQIHRA